MMANLINATANDLGLLLVELSIISFISLWIIKVIYPPVKKLPLYEIGRVIIAFFSVSMIWLSIEFAQNAWSGKAIATPILLILGIQIFLWSIGLMSVSSESLDDRIRKSLLTESVDTRKMLLLQRQRLSQSLQRGEILREYLAKMTTFLVTPN